MIKIWTAYNSACSVDYHAQWVGPMSFFSPRYNQHLILHQAQTSVLFPEAGYKI